MVGKKHSMRGKCFLLQYLIIRDIMLSQQPFQASQFRMRGQWSDAKDTMRVISSSASQSSSQLEKWENNLSNCTPKIWWLPSGDENSGSISFKTSTTLPGIKKWRAIPMRSVQALECFTSSSLPINLNKARNVRKTIHVLLRRQSICGLGAYTCWRVQGRWRAVIGAKSLPIEREPSMNENNWLLYRPAVLRSRFNALVRTTAQRIWVGKSISTIVHASKRTLHILESSFGVASCRSCR